MSQQNVEIVKRMLWDGRVWLDFFKPWDSLRFETKRIVPQGDKVLE